VTLLERLPAVSGHQRALLGDIDEERRPSIGARLQPQK
jgi:hypothetical protein